MGYIPSSPSSLPPSSSNSLKETEFGVDCLKIEACKCGSNVEILKLGTDTWPFEVWACSASGPKWENNGERAWENFRNGEKWLSSSKLDSTLGKWSVLLSRKILHQDIFNLSRFVSISTKRRDVENWFGRRKRNSKNRRGQKLKYDTLSSFQQHIPWPTSLVLIPTNKKVSC